MNVYVESNFVLELALLQEQQASCEEILRLCEQGKVRLIVPAYSLAEPHETLVRRHKQRRRMKADLDEELRQLARTVTFTQRLSGLQDLTALLIDSADEEVRRLENVQSRLLKAAEIVSLEVPIFQAAMQYQRIHDLSPGDAIVYASVLAHLRQSAVEHNCFLNRNSKDFDDPEIIEELNRHNCILIPRFNDGYRYLLSRLGDVKGA